MKDTNTQPANVNNNHNTIHIEYPSQPANKPGDSNKKSKVHWLVKAIVLGFISFLVLLCAYFVQKKLDTDRKDKLAVPPVENQIQGIKQN